MVGSHRLSSLQMILWCLLAQASYAFISPYRGHAIPSKGLLSKATPNAEDGDSKDSFESDRRSILRNVAIASLTTAVPFPPKSANAATIATAGGEIIYGDESIMAQKEHGTTSSPVQENLRYDVSRKLADRICCYNRHFAELGGYFESKSFDDTMRKLTSSSGGPVTFYDSVTGKPLFVAPINRSVEEFLTESKIHGWPSFRDDEVVWDNVRILRNSGETVSVDGTHLGHNLPDKKGSRYCINLVSIAGNPVETSSV